MGQMLLFFILISSTSEETSTSPLYRKILNIMVNKSTMYYTLCLVAIKHHISYITKIYKCFFLQLCIKIGTVLSINGTF